MTFYILNKIRSKVFLCLTTPCSVKCLIFQILFFCLFFWLRGTKNHKKRVFSRLILDAAYCFFLPPFSFQIRVGGLYLLYSLYHSQTARPAEQVRAAALCGLYD